MAVNQSIHLLPGLTGVVGVIERLSEPGMVRHYWDATARAWSGSPPPHIPVTPDPDIPGIYRLLVPSRDTAGWPDGVYRATLLNPEVDGPDQVAEDPWMFLMMGGDDGGLGHPSITIPWLGSTITFWGARFNYPSRT